MSVAYSGSEPARTITVDWESDSSGDFTETLERIRGMILRVGFLPDAGGTQPTDLYDLTLTDKDGFDCLKGQGANLGNAADTETCPGQTVTDGTNTNIIPVMVDGDLTLVGANCGDTKGGVVVIYID